MDAKAFVPQDRSSASVANFLSLPLDVRGRIYRYAGISTGVYILIDGHNSFLNTCSLTMYARNKGYFTSHPEEDTNFCLGVKMRYRKIRKVSRAVRADIAHFLLANNKIVLRCGDDEYEKALSLFLRASPDWIGSLRHLTILLNVSSKREPASCWCARCPYRQFHAQAPLALASPRFNRLLPLWTRVVHRLVQHSSPGLELRIVCDVVDLNTAQGITAPLKNLTSAACTVRLGGERNAALERLSQELRLRLLETAEPVERPFRFLDLPTEVRHEILSYTNLVTPFREVEWIWKRQVYACPWLSSSAWLPCSLREFCERRYAVFSQCKCWQPPTALFLVCRTMLHDARAVFFSSNRFIVQPCDSYKCQDKKRRRESQFESSGFLAKLLSEDALQHLRTLELVFPYALYNCDGWNIDVWIDWVHTIDNVASHLKRLSLRLYLGYNFNSMLPEGYAVDGDLLEAERELFRLYEYLVRPLAKLKCLDFLLVEVAAPLGDNEGWYCNRREAWDAYARHIHHLLMGDKPANNKPVQTQSHKSQWRYLRG